MKAVLFPGESRFEIVERDDPIPDFLEVVIKLTKSGICGSDIHYWHETAEARQDRAHVVPGHETVGIVHSVGPGVTRFAVSDRVVAGVLHIGCGYCKVCLSGEYGMCRDKQVFGRNLDGSYAEYVRSPERALYHLPEEVPDDVAVLAACNLSTAYSALARADIRPREVVVVFGLGGVGLCAVMLAAESGAKVVGIDPIATRREKAASLGAKTVEQPDGLSAMISNGFIADAAIECSGHPFAQQQSIDVLRPGGRTVVVGVGGRYSFPAEDLVRRKATLIGSLVCRPDEFQDILEIAGSRVEELRTLLGPTIHVDEVEKGLRHAQEGGEGKVLFHWDPKA